jgi:hypothetical protein
MFDSEHSRGSPFGVGGTAFYRYNIQCKNA